MSKMGITMTKWVKILTIECSKTEDKVPDDARG